MLLLSSELVFFSDEGDEGERDASGHARREIRAISDSKIEVQFPSDERERERWGERGEVTSVWNEREENGRGKINRPKRLNVRR